MDFLKVQPKKKLAYPTVQMDNNVYIGGFGSITKYDDPNNSVATLINLMDGSRTVAEITDIMVEKFKDLTKEDVIEAIVDMSHDGFLEDTNHIGSDILNNYELERYHRNINFFSTYATLDVNKYKIQKKICDTKVCIIGLGGLGSHIAYDLAGLGIGHIKAIEFDTVDLSNLNRQILYNYEDIGQKKATLAEKRIKQFNPNINFTAIEKKITSAEDVAKEIKGFDYVILVADRPKTLLARWVNEGIVKSNIPLLCAGLEAQRAMHYTVVPGVTGCIECWLSSVSEKDPISYAVLEERRRLDLTGDNTAIVPLVSTITGMICAELIRLITGIRPSTSSGKLISIDFDTMSTKVAEEWSKNEKCTLCSTSKKELEVK
ncbi:ThiF family adenylyltransferase [Bacillus fungorum]|uniref:HesA/MoeB/ThiF family protein n=1 Tax=Bacillus fungorum TaxID=2039284 RepID=UPI003390AF63